MTDTKDQRDSDKAMKSLTPEYSAFAEKAKIRAHTSVSASSGKSRGSVYKAVKSSFRSKTNSDTPSVAKKRTRLPDNSTIRPRIEKAVGAISHRHLMSAEESLHPEMINKASPLEISRPALIYDAPSFMVRILIHRARE